MHHDALATQLLLVHQVVRQVDDEAVAVDSQHLASDATQRRVRGQAEREPVVHRQRIGEQQAITLGAVAWPAGQPSRK